MKRHQAAGADARVEYRVDDPRLDRLLARATREFKSHPDDPRYYEAVKQFIDEADPQPSYLDEAHARRRYASFLQMTQWHDRQAHLANCEQALHQVSEAVYILETQYSKRRAKPVFYEYFRALSQEAHLALELNNGPALEGAVRKMDGIVRDFPNHKFTADHYDFSYQLHFSRKDYERADRALEHFKLLYRDGEQTIPPSYYLHRLKLDLLEHEAHLNDSEPQKQEYVKSLEQSFWKAFDAHKADYNEPARRDAARWSLQKDFLHWMMIATVRVKLGLPSYDPPQHKVCHSLKDYFDLQYVRVFGNRWHIDDNPLMERKAQEMLDSHRCQLSHKRFDDIDPPAIDVSEQDCDALGLRDFIGRSASANIDDNNDDAQPEGDASRTPGLS